MTSRNHADSQTATLICPHYPSHNAATATGFAPVTSASTAALST
jgi:hypothetical protein